MRSRVRPIEPVENVAGVEEAQAFVAKEAGCAGDGWWKNLSSPGELLTLSRVGVA